MIDKEYILNELGDSVAVWCASDLDGGELARVVEHIVDKKITDVSVSPDSISVVWPWLEGVGVKIFGRFYLDDVSPGAGAISDITAKINTALRTGATGAQVFVRYASLSELVGQTHIVRDDLFFDKELVIGLDINEIGAYDWAGLFGNLKKIKASAVMFFLGDDMGDKSDFIGRLYGMLNSWDDEFSGALQFALGENFARIEQAKRLTTMIKPALAKRLKFFIS